MVISALARMSAAAPSEIEDEFAAVTVPSFAKAGLRVGILEASALPGCSSIAITVSPLRPATFTETISPSNEPSVVARLARFSDSMA